jgi:DNA-binding transcriptional ArsR family regulator/rhodanese-related sulfurtransferase
MGDAGRKSELFEQLARVGKALGSGKRLELLDLLAQAPRGVADLAAAAGLGLTTTSAHLQTLKQAGLVSTSREGTTIRYRLADGAVAALFAQLRSVAAARLPDVDAARVRYLGLDAGDTEQVDREELLRRVAAGEVVVLDVRPGPEFAAGHIPGAVSAPTTENVGADGCFLPAGELRARFEGLGVTEDARVGVYCGSGVSAAHEVLALAVAGMPAELYVGSWSEWSSDPDRPVAVGPDPR